MSRFEELETWFNVSVLESKALDASCQDLGTTSRKSLFPEVDSDLLQKFNANSKEIEPWHLVLNNYLFNGAPNCNSKEEGTGKSKCTIDIYGDLEFDKNSQKAAFMLWFPLSKVFFASNSV